MKKFDVVKFLKINNDKSLINRTKQAEYPPQRFTTHSFTVLSVVHKHQHWC